MVQYNATYVGPFREDGGYERDSAGAESNVAVNLAKLGIGGLETVWVSRLGDDSEGEFVLKELAGRTHVAAKQYEGHRTGTSYLNHFADDRHVKTYQRKGSAASTLTFSDVEPHLRHADLLHVTGITPALSGECRDAVFESLRYAKGNGVVVSFDVNYREQLWGPDEARSVFDEMLGYADLFKVGHDEAETVWTRSYSPEQYARHFHECGAKVVVVTRGAMGAVAFDGTHLVEHGGYRVAAIDPIGAGDAFVAGFLGGILQHQTLRSFFGRGDASRAQALEKGLDVANVCGTLTCTRRGDTAAMPTMNEVREFMRSSRAGE